MYGLLDSRVRLCNFVLNDIHDLAPIGRDIFDALGKAESQGPNDTL
jgi:hypothetical protein